MTTGPDLIPVWIDGRLTPFDKIAAHLEGRRHKAVSVFVMRGDEMLIQQRAVTKYHTPGLWANACCTHPHWDEAPEDCASRRLDQELGITGLAPRPVGQVEYRAEVGGGMTEHEVVDIFRADAPADLRIAPNPGEVMATEWIAFDALDRAMAAQPERFTPWLHIYLTRHREMILRA